MKKKFLNDFSKLRETHDNKPEYISLNLKKIFDEQSNDIFAVLVIRGLVVEKIYSDNLIKNFQHFFVDDEEKELINSIE